MIGYLRRTVLGFEVTPETLAFEVMQRVGPGGNFLTDEHTLRHARSEFWIPRLSDRDNYITWQRKGRRTMLERAAARRDQILREHYVEPLDEALELEIDRIVAAAGRQLLA
jgi:trimethylamine--corrinoid protein Co-methyltransferase